MCVLETVHTIVLLNLNLHVHVENVMTYVYFFSQLLQKDRSKRLGMGENDFVRITCFNDCAVVCIKINVNLSLRIFLYA